MKQLCNSIARLPELRELAERIAAGRCPVSVSGLSPVHRAMIAAALRFETRRPIVVLCADEGEARRMAADLQTLTGEGSMLLLAREPQLRDRVSASHGFEHQRLGTLCALASGGAPVLAATVDAVMQRTLPPSALLDAVMTLGIGERYDLGELSRRLSDAGYARAEQVEGVGQFAVRGGILDVWSPLAEPVRVEFFDDEIDAMGEFDITTQRRTKNIKKLSLLPAAEVLPDAAEGGRDALLQRIAHAADRLEKKHGADRTVQTLRADAERFSQRLPVGGMDRYLSACYPTATTALDYFPRDAVVFISDSARAADRAKGFLFEQEQDILPPMEAGELAGEFSECSIGVDELQKRLKSFPAVQLNALPTSRELLPSAADMSMNVKQLPAYGGSLETAAEDMGHYIAARFGVLVLCGNEARGRNLLRLLEERGVHARPDFKNEQLPGPGEAAVGLGTLSAGSELPQLQLAVLTEGQLTAATSGKRRAARQTKDSSRRKLQSYTDLSPGDLVVHVHHGIGRFVGIERMRVDGVDKDYIKIAYAGNDSLYVPATQLDLVAKYIGGGEDEDGNPRAKLSKLGGGDWARTKTRAKAAAKDLAKGLIALYAERKRRPGFAFSPDSPWQSEFEDAFDYAETGDQLRAIDEIKRDMESSVPMDRLLCGDVGYGKTEVALRAAMKCILDGKQAAILVPTTVLAQQHYSTALARFGSFPVRIDTISRFRTPTERKRVLEATAEGRVDLLIGTHSLLQKNMRFKDLGLLIIDEEQRFGVSHKERLRELARQVDTLTLTATPIPRTLNMALSGLRDMSTLDMPPEGRQPVQTYVLEHDWGVVADAIRRELGRGGQAYYLHNRVHDSNFGIGIDACAAKLRQQLGEDVRIAVAHGKQSKEELEAVMQDMVSGEVQVLVCTTIIETGIDIPNVNTLIVDNAHCMGLAQLHQLRGRIGRSSRRAYAYMTYPRNRALTEVAEKRLAAIREYAEFGAGFRVAMRDLEIRGAGNLLGPEQSGYMMTVGYDMYLQLLEEAILEERGEKKTRRSDTAADLTVSANLPESYISSPEQRLDVYRRIAALQTQEESRDLLDELLDRYGEPPKSVLTLMDVALLRTAAAEVGVRDITQRGENVTFTFSDGFPVEAVMRLCSSPRNRRRLTLSAGTEPKLTMRLAKDEDVLKSAHELVNELHIN